MEEESLVVGVQGLALQEGDLPNEGEEVAKTHVTSATSDLREALVMEAAVAVYRESLVQARRRRLGLNLRRSDDGESFGGEYDQTRFGLPELPEEQAEGEMKAIDEAAAMAVATRAQPAVHVRQFLKETLTSLQFDLPEEVNQTIDAILQAERKDAREIAPEDIPCLYGGGKVAVWRGDITTLRVDGIVNAANEYMLGCSKPNHPCIDNAIHCKAGPRLREACRTLMRQQGHLEKTGMAKITPAYNLPSRFVLHTVGPICHPKGHVAAGQAEQLRSCYWECLELAKQHGLRTVAFCCLSTGVFGYPQEDAAPVALKAVQEWLGTENGGETMDLIIFNVFTPRDLQIYTELAPLYFVNGKNATKETNGVMDGP